MLLAFAVLATLASVVRSHGLCCTPRQRASYHELKCGFAIDSPPAPPDAEQVKDHCGHCLNGGTVSTVKANLPRGGWKLYEPIKDFEGTATRASLCGDPKGNTDHMIGGDFMPYPNVPIMQHYKKGGEVDFSVEIDTNHNGYFEFFLCDLDSCGTNDIEGKCFKQGHCYKLLRVPHPDCEDLDVNTDYECGPIDPKYPGRWYLPCRNTPHVGIHIVGGPSGTMRYKLPPGVSCRHCVLQWYWATANSCAPRGFLDYMDTFDNPFGTTCESDGGGRGAHRDGMGGCGGEAVPEEFWSCADVQITDSGKSAGPVKAVGVKNPGDDDSQPTDEEEVQENPDEVLEKAKEELEKDINATASESSGDRKKKEEEEANGKCAAEGGPCDNTEECCEIAMVCVNSYGKVGFECRFWWALHKDVELREAAMKNK